MKELGSHIIGTNKDCEEKSSDVEKVQEPKKHVAKTIASNQPIKEEFPHAILSDCVNLVEKHGRSDSDMNGFPRSDNQTMGHEIDQKERMFGVLET
jgi:hypothetical protein